MKKIRTLIAVLTAAVMAMTALCISSAAAAYSWTGTWDSSWGEMKLTQNGSKVTGTYTHDGGSISGTVSGNTLTGTWTEPGQRGRIKFVMSSDGKSFSGGWSYNDADPGDSGWNATRKTAVTTIDSTAKASASLSDVKWNSSAKKLTFTIKFANVGSDAWVGIVPAGTADDEKSADKVDVTYIYLSRLTSGKSASLSASLKTGSYELRVYANDSGGALLSRAKFKVGSTSSALPSGTMLKVYLEKGKTLRLGAIVSGKNASSLKYSTSDSKVATVSSGGKVKGISAGGAVITVKSGSTAIKVYVVVE